MKKKIELSGHGHTAWVKLCDDFSLSSHVAQQLMHYMHELHEWNQKTNLTRIIDWYEVIQYHIRDALVLSTIVDCNQSLLLCDVGTGGGIPGIPLKIVYPHLKIILIEVVERKVVFLNHVIQDLALDGIEVCTLDWRTFIRTTDAPVNYFLARASLRPDELLRAYKSGSAYHDARIVYWATKFWQPSMQEQSFLKSEYHYDVGTKERKLVFFAKSSE